MKILGICGSPRQKKTYSMIQTVCQASGVDYEIIELRNSKINPCRNCKSCHKSFECIQKDDMQQIYSKLINADVIILGSPTHFDNVSGLMKNFMDRCLPLYFSRKLKGKKVIALTIGGFKSLIDLDGEGKCRWCEEGGDCSRTVSRCIDSLKYFSRQVGMEIVDELYAIHGDPEAKKEELTEIGRKLCK